jgi:Cof subfamily protein (haloacid dehalogenase superfamily)
MRYKLVALDLDGTLLNSQGQIPERHIEAVKKAQKTGVHVVIATGRYYMQTERIMNQLGFKGILVSNDGTVTINAESKKVIGECSYSIDEVAPFIQYCREHNIHFSICTAFDYFVEIMDDFHEEQHRLYDITHTFHDDILSLKEDVMKFTIVDQNKIGGWQSIQLPTPDSLRRRIDMEFRREYVSAKSSKTNALKKVLQALGISQTEMIAIGDYYNDLDMIEYAGLGIAMGNAPEDIKSKANDVTLSNDEDGVYYALEKHLYQ